MGIWLGLAEWFIYSTIHIFLFTFYKIIFLSQALMRKKKKAIACQNQSN